MGITYSDVLSLYFKDSEFSTRDVTTLLRTERSAKLLSDLKFKGIVERTGRGMYRLLPPSERIDERKREWERIERIINSSPLEFAWTWSSAVEKWTRGRYLVSPNPYFRVFYIEVNRNDLSEWARYLYKHSVSITGKRRIGAMVKLVPRKNVKPVILNSEPVISKERTIYIIRHHRDIFAEADDLIENRSEDS